MLREFVEVLLIFLFNNLYRQAYLIDIDLYHYLRVKLIVFVQVLHNISTILTKNLNVINTVHTAKITWAKGMILFNFQRFCSE